MEERRRAAVLAWSMLTWGGVTRQEAFSEATVEAVFRRALGLAEGRAAPMNSGWTKVAGSAIVCEVRDVMNEGGHGWMPLPDGGEGRWTIRGVPSVSFMDGY